MALYGLKIAIETMLKALDAANCEMCHPADSAFHVVSKSESGNGCLPKACNLTAKALEGLRLRLQCGAGTPLDSENT